MARVRPALFLYAAGSCRGASFNHVRRRSQRGDWTVTTIRGGDLAAAIGSRPIRYRPWDRALVVIGAAGYRGRATITSGVVLADWKSGSRPREAISTTDPAPRRAN